MKEEYDFDLSNKLYIICSTLSAALLEILLAEDRTTFASWCSWELLMTFRHFVQIGFDCFLESRYIKQPAEGRAALHSLSTVFHDNPERPQEWIPELETAKRQ